MSKSFFRIETGVAESIKILVSKGLTPNTFLSLFILLNHYILQPVFEVFDFFGNLHHIVNSSGGGGGVEGCNPWMTIRYISWLSCRHVLFDKQWFPDRLYPRYPYHWRWLLLQEIDQGLEFANCYKLGPANVEANAIVMYFQQQNYPQSSHRQFPDGTNQRFEG